MVVAGRMSAKSSPWDGGDFFPLRHVGDEHAGADDVGDFAAEGLDGAFDGGEGAAGLGADVGGVSFVGVDADGAGDEDHVAFADGAGVAEFGLPGGAGGAGFGGTAVGDDEVGELGTFCTS